MIYFRHHYFCFVTQNKKTQRHGFENQLCSYSKAKTRKSWFSKTFHVKIMKYLTQRRDFKYFPTMISSSLIIMFLFPEQNTCTKIKIWQSSVGLIIHSVYI